MGLMEFLVFVFVVVLICAVAVFALQKIPGCPSWVPSLVWLLCAVIIIFRLLQAMGVLQHDPQIPSL